MSAELIDRVETARRNWRRFLRARAAVRMLLAILVLGGLLALADYTWIFSQGFRQAIWIGLGVIAIAFLFRRLLRPRGTVSRQETALEIETAFPQLGQRVCTTVEYAEPTPTTMPAWPSMVKALTTETQQQTDRLDFEEVVPWRRLRLPTAAAAGLVVFFLALFLFQSGAWIASLRLFLVPAQYSKLEVKPGDRTVNTGNDVAIQAIISGRPVEKAELLYRKAKGKDPWTAVSLGPQESDETDADARLAGTLETSLKNCREDLEYRVIAGPIESGVYRLTIVHPLELKKIEADIEAPAYTGKKSRTVKKGDFSVPEGSAVRFRFTLDRPAQIAQLRITPGKKAGASAQALPAVPLAIEGNVLCGVLNRVTRDLEYEIQAEAADGMKLEPRRFRISVRPDRQPTVRLLKPQVIIEATPTTEVTIQAAARDDYGLTKVGIAYQIGDGPEKVLRLDDDPQRPVSLSSLATLYLEEHPVQFPGGVVYYAFAEDNCPGGAHRAVSEVHYIDIRPYKREYQILKAGGT